MKRTLTAICLLLFVGIHLQAHAQPGATQIVRGEVADRDTETPLPGASVFVAGTDPVIGTATDSDGRFVLEHVPLGRQDIVVQFLGYEPARIAQVLVTTGKEVVLRILLRESVVTGAEVVVTAGPSREPSNDFASVSARSFTVEETRRYAGGLDDPARMASAFAGVTTGAGISENAMIIRGNAPKGVVWRLEGVDIPNPSHFANMAVVGGGGLTLFSAHLVAGGDFFTGAFPANYGNALAGVFDVQFRRGNPARREYAIQVGLIGLDVSAEGPFVRGQEATFLFNYRYSTLGLLLPLLPTEDVAAFQDLSFKLSFPSRKSGRWEVWGIGGLDSQSMGASADSASWEFETWDRIDATLHLGVGAAGLSNILPLGRRAVLRTSLAGTVHHTGLRQNRMGSDLQLHDHLRVTDTAYRGTLSSNLTLKLNSRLTTSAGAMLDVPAFNLDVRYAPEEAAPLRRASRGSGTSSMIRAFAQARIDPTARLSTSVGLAAQYFALTGGHSIEPRFGLRHSLGKSYAVRLGYGLHSQIEDMRVYLVQQPDASNPNRRLEPARAHHFVAGVDRALGGWGRATLETYYQHLFGVPVAPDSSFSMLNFEQDFTFDTHLVNEGLGRNYGLEMTVERFLQGGFYFLLTGSLFRSRYAGGDGVWRNSRFDRRYAGNALAGWERSVGERSILGVNVRAITMGGRRRGVVDEAASRAAEEVLYDATRAFEAREPDLLIFDVTLTYRRNRRRVSEVWALQIKNLLAAKDVYHDYSFKTDRVEEVREGFPLPMLSWKLEF